MIMKLVLLEVGTTRYKMMMKLILHDVGTTIGTT